MGQLIDNEAEEFIGKLFCEGKATVNGVELKLEYPADSRLRCKICYNLVQDHTTVIVLIDGTVVYRLCNLALIYPGNLVLDGEDDTFFFEETK